MENMMKVSKFGFRLVLAMVCFITAFAVVQVATGCSEDKPKPMWSKDEAKLAIETRLGLYRPSIERYYMGKNCLKAGRSRANVEYAGGYGGRIPLALLEGGRVMHSMLAEFDQMALGAGCRQATSEERVAAKMAQADVLTRVRAAISARLDEYAPQIDQAFAAGDCEKVQKVRREVEDPNKYSDLASHDTLLAETVMHSKYEEYNRRYDMMGCDYGCKVNPVVLTSEAVTVKGIIPAPTDGVEGSTDWSCWRLDNTAGLEVVTVTVEGPDSSAGPHLLFNSDTAAGIPGEGDIKRSDEGGRGFTTVVKFEGKDDYALFPFTVSDFAYSPDGGSREMARSSVEFTMTVTPVKLSEVTADTGKAAAAPAKK